MPRDRSTRKPSASSVTEATKPGPARVTSTPAADAASTSTLRMSTAQRDEGAQFRQFCKNLPSPFRQPVGDDDVDVMRSLDQTARIQRVVGFIQDDLRHGLQAGF